MCNRLAFIAKTRMYVRNVFVGMDVSGVFLFRLRTS